MITTFVYDVEIDGTNIAGITLSGGTIQYGATSGGEQPGPTTAHFTLISADAAGDLVSTYPGISWRGGIPSGFVTEYADEYEGALSALKPGSPVTIKTATDSGFEDTYVGTYATGFDSVRFSGYITAIDYLPGTVTVTAIDEIERLTRAPIARASWPSESEAARLTRICSAASITPTIQGTGLAAVAATATDAEPETPWRLLVELAASAGSLVYVNRDGQLIYRCHDDIHDTKTVLAPEVTLRESLEMSIELGRVRNSITVEYDGGEITATDSSSVTAYGARDGGKLKTILANATDAQTRADRYLTAYAEPRWHLPNVTAFLKFAWNDRDIADLLSLDLDDVLELPQLLPASPEASYASRVIGYTETLAPEAWEMTYVLDPHGWSEEGITQ